MMEKMKEFGLELDHISIEKVTAGDKYHLYFFLDVVNALFDSIFQVKQKRIEKMMKGTFDSELGVEESLAGTSGGEEVSKILNDARKTFGKVQSFRHGLGIENISMIKPVRSQKFFPPEQQKSKRRKSEAEEFSVNIEHESSGSNQSPVKVARSRKRKSKSNKKLSEKAKNEEINLKIPTSDTTDVVLKVKPLASDNIEHRRLHVRVNKKSTPKSSRKIVYGSKSVISHHLRKPRQPMFSSKVVTPKLNRKQVLKNVVDFANDAKREEDLNKIANEPKHKNKELEAKLKCQRLVREKRTENAQLKRLLTKLQK